MFRVSLEDEPGSWKIVTQEILLSADAVQTARLLSVQSGRAYRLEEYGTDLPESREKKHYEMVLDPGKLETKLSNLG